MSYATTTVLNKLNSLKSSKRFEGEKRLWSGRGAQVDSVRDLLLQYYGNFKVVFIPQFLPKRPVCSAADLQRRYGRLYSEIVTLAAQSAECRQQSGILFDMESLSWHTLTDLSQVSADPDSTIDLHSLAESTEAYPSSFKTHVLNFLSRCMETSVAAEHSSYLAEAQSIRRIQEYIALCVAGKIMRGKGVYPFKSSLIL